MRTPSHVTRFVPFLIALLFALAGCVHTAATLDDDLRAFSNGVDAVLVAGMPLKQARAAIRDRFPRAAQDSESAPLIAGTGNALRNRRFIMVWPTTTPGTSFVLTIECDREMHVARWATGPLYHKN